MPLERSSAPELLDRAGTAATPEELAGNLRDIRRANRYFGGARAVLAAIEPDLRRLAGGAEPVTVLDLATGSADIPVAIAERAAKRGWRVHVTATDSQPEIVAEARRAEREGTIAVAQADARCLPHGDGAFDIVLLSLALHHFEPDDALATLREMRRVARRRMIINDLERSRAGLAGAWLFSRALTRNRLTRHDAPLSARRAYTRAEALAIAREAGWTNATARGALPFRFVLTGQP